MAGGGGLGRPLQNGFMQSRILGQCPPPSLTLHTKMPQCSFYTHKFTQCTRNAQAGTHYCRAHGEKVARMPLRLEGGCPCVVAGTHWCGNPLHEGNAICERHARRRDRAAAYVIERAEMLAAANLLTDEYMFRDPRPVWTWVVDDVKFRMNLPADDFRVLPRLTAFITARQFFLQTTPNTVPVHTLMRYWAGIPDPDAAPPPRGQMELLATDTQNVHREVVVTQTNTNVEILLALAEEAPEDLDPEQWVTTWWLLMPGRPVFAEYYRVIQDVHAWYTRRTCKATGDYLYAKVFNGAVYKISQIESYELRHELAKRLWEECLESVEMCCEGHISRLANVFVGFDEAFKSPASPSEMLQAQIAEIANLKLRTETKLAKAKAVMDQLGIPDEERAPWLAALAE
jgi:hypothetical protein